MMGHDQTRLMRRSGWEAGGVDAARETVDGSVNFQASPRR